MISRIDHVAIAVSDFDGAERFFRSVLGALPGSEGSDPKLKYFWRIYSLGDLSRMEILAPTGEGSFLEGFLAGRKRGGVHHITVQTPDIAAAKRFLEEQGIPYFGYGESGANWKEFFIHPKDAFGVLIQVAEFEPDEWLNPAVNVDGGKRWTIRSQEHGFVFEMAHPGGGKATVDFSRDELQQLLSDLRNALEESE